MFVFSTVCLETQVSFYQHSNVSCFSTRKDKINALSSVVRLCMSIQIMSPMMQ